MSQETSQEEMSNKPSRNGKKWEEDEIQLLLQSIREKRSVEDIAREHRRTPGAITSELRKIAYHFWTKKKSVEEIVTLTGLSKEEVELAIARRHKDDGVPPTRREKAIERKMIQHDIKELQGALVSIRNQMNVLISKLG